MSIERIYTVGFPRSGQTAFFLGMAETMETPVFRISETDELHPVHGHGLLKIKENSLFLFIVRPWHWIESSFLTARYIVQNELQEFRTSPMPELYGIASVTDVRIKWMWSFWLLYVSQMIPLLSPNLVFVRYEMLDDEDYIYELRNELCRRGVKVKDNFPEWFLENWNKKPVRGGALSYAVRVEKLEEEWTN